MKRTIIIYINFFLLIFLIPIVSHGDETKPVRFHKERFITIQPIDLEKRIQRFIYNSGLHFDYPDAVRGIFLTGHSVGGSRFETLLELVEETDLNAMVIDIKDDWGNITFKVEEGSPFEDISKNYIGDPHKMMEVLEEKQVYPIARVVVFKDTALAEKNPDLSFTENGKVWKNDSGEAFVNPFLKEV